MYHLINENIGLLLDAIKPERDIYPYTQLNGMCRDHKLDVSVSKEFKKLYRKYWQLNAAHLNEDYVEAYFKLLQECRSINGADVSVEQIARKLYQFPTHSKKRYSLQFSFATKLVHTLRPESPVYDETVQAFFFLPPRPLSGSLDQKLRRFSQVYSFLIGEYQRVLREQRLGPSIAIFRSKYDSESSFTDEKIVDTLIWQFVKCIRNRNLEDGAFVYR